LDKGQQPFFLTGNALGEASAGDHARPGVELLGCRRCRGEVAAQVGVEKGAPDKLDHAAAWHTLWEHRRTQENRGSRDVGDGIPLRGIHPVEDDRSALGEVDVARVEVAVAHGVAPGEAAKEGEKGRALVFGKPGGPRDGTGEVVFNARKGRNSPSVHLEVEIRQEPARFVNRPRSALKRFHEGPAHDLLVDDPEPFVHLRHPVHRGGRETGRVDSLSLSCFVAGIAFAPAGAEQLEHPASREAEDLRGATLGDAGTQVKTGRHGGL